MKLKFLDSIIGSIGGIIDKCVTSERERAKAKTLLGTTLLGHLDQIYDMQRQTLLAEMNGNWLQRSWRPIVMLCFAGIVVAGVFFDIPYLNDDSPFWTLLQIGLGGYIVGRSAEKISSQIIKQKKL